MAAFHLLLEGKSDYKPMKGMEERMHVIGSGDNPVYICKKKEVPELFNDEFFYCYTIWKYYHAGLGLPNALPWYHPDQNEAMVNTIIDMETHYQNNFSHNKVILLYLEAIIKRLDRGIM